ncbi:MAG TPA: TIGR03668 family PPOX class F420-dependent oxidoreductase [Candidatus Limnocylindrales bacterium]|nr:TIGR03668 family PPOX class F420-dependent oxidoreductase [Candidatus Limnocylindrales bacterium]
MTAVLSDTESAFLISARTATLATIAPDSRPRLVPICFVLADGDGDRPPTLYTPLDEKPKSTTDPRDLARVRDIRERPAVTLLVDRWSEDWSQLAWLRIQGRAALVEPRRNDAHLAVIIGRLRAKYPQYVDQALESRPIIAVTIERATSWGSISPSRSGHAGRSGGRGCRR